MNKAISCGLALAACTAVGMLSYAAVTFDNNGNPTFVGKGDIQSLYGWNNNALQQCASWTGLSGPAPIAGAPPIPENGYNNCLEFAVGKESSAHWRCIRFNNNNTVVQDRSGTFSDMRTGNLTGRLNNQITGFHLWTTSAESVVATGNELGSCPSAPGWELVDHCNEIDAQGNHGAPIEGCSLQNGIHYWSTGGTAELSVRDIRTGFDNEWKFLAVSPE